MKGVARAVASRLVAGVICGVLVALCACSTESDQETCTTEHLATLPTVPALGFLAVPVSLGDKPAVMLIDTGAQTSMIASGQDKALGLEKDPHRTTSLIGSGGGRVKVDNVIIRGVRFGNRETGELSLPVGSFPGRLANADPPIAGLLGLDVLELYDLDIDRPRHRIDLYLRSDCDTDLPSWTGVANRIALIKATNNLLLMPVYVDGVRLEAIVDTGAIRTVISASAMARLGLDEAAVAGDPATGSEGVDGLPGHGHRHRFDSVRIGAITFHDARVDVGSSRLATGDMLLGEDFFRHFRLWLSPSTATAFVALPPVVRPQQTARK